MYRIIKNINMKNFGIVSSILVALYYIFSYAKDIEINTEKANKALSSVEQLSQKVQGVELQISKIEPKINEATEAGVKKIQSQIVEMQNHKKTNYCRIKTGRF